MSSILDLVTGGGLLPHVYCKKVTLERNANDSSKTDVTLLLELYQDKNALSNSTWLNNLSAGGVNLLDALFIQVLPFTKHDNVQKLHPSRVGLGLDAGGESMVVTTPAQAISEWKSKTDHSGFAQFPGNVYVGKNVFGDNYLPRGRFTKIVEQMEQGLVVSTTTYTATGTETLTPGALFSSLSSEFGGQGLSGVPEPIQISNSSLLGNIAGADLLSSPGQQLFAREEIINGKPYSIIPFEYKYTGFDESANLNSLGFAFYTFLHTPYWISQLDLGSNLLDPAFFEEFVVEGPINTEIVFFMGEVQKTREAFFLPSGQIWEGSVHLHAIGVNSAPDGYEGDGLLSRAPQVDGETGEITDFGGEFRGWMAGDKHILGAPKLKLAQVPNNKISDIRHGLFPEPLDEALGLGSQTEIFNLSEAVSDIEKFLSPFQKEKRKDFVKDSDSEFSKLYICRDKNNNARGMFSINARELLKNNSNLFSLFRREIQVGDPNFEAEITNIIQKSEILQLKVYRDRVKKHAINTRYENYSNDEMYEEPSKLIGILNDTDGWMTPNQNNSLAEVTGLPVSLSNPTRYFMFSDFEVGKKSAGLYQYRIVLEFKDGTYEYLYELYKELSEVKTRLDSYYDFAISGVSSVSDDEISFNNALVTEEYKKKNFIKYYQNGAWIQSFDEWAAFWIASLLGKHDIHPEVLAYKNALVADPPRLMKKIQNIFGIFPKITGGELDFEDISITNLISYTNGSPKGIDFFSRLLSTSIKKIQSLISTTKVNKTGSEITSTSVPNGYTLNSMLDVIVSPSLSTIMEEHTFDHPSELFEGTSNENIYADYLSIGNPLFSSYQGLRSLRTDYFINRCRLEAAKLSPIAQTEEGFNGQGDNTQFNIGMVFQPFGAPLQELSDYFSRTGYSYLAPSIVRLADPIKETAGYNFYYSCFKPSAQMYFNTGAPATELYSSIFTDWSNYDKVFMSLLNYSFSKADSTDADLTDASYNSDTIKPGSVGVMEAVLRLREPYKRTFEELGMTFHEPSAHDLFFKKESGAISIDVPDKDEFPLSVDDFSDGITFPLNFFKDFLYNSQQSLVHLKRFTPSPEPYNRDLPNSFKIHQAQISQKSHKNKSILQPTLQTVFDNALDNKYNTFFFFQINLTMKIEVFRGIMGNSKNDEGSWTLLTQDDLPLPDNKKLFCRLSLFDESLTRKIKLPTLDKYFLIYNNATNQIAPVEPLILVDTQVAQYDTQGFISGFVTETTTY